MGHRPVLPLLMSMAFPLILSTPTWLLYDIVDSMFVVQIGEDVLAAVSLAFPIQVLIVARSVGIGIGANSYIVRKLGEQNQKEANSTVVHGLLLPLIGYLLFVAVGSFTIRPFLEMFVDSTAILDDACIYIYVCVSLCFGCFFHILIEKIFQPMGKMISPMVIQAVGAIANIALDPIMIFGLLGFPVMGVKGTAIAMVIGQAFAMSLSLFILLTGKFDVKLDLKRFHFSQSTTCRILSIGIPNAYMNALGSVFTIGLNSILIQFSNTVVSAYGICYKLQTFVFMPASGLTWRAMPIMGYNYGVGSHERLLQTLKYTIMMTLAITICDCAAFLLFPTQLPMLFRASKDMLRIGVPALRIIGISSLPAALGFILPTLFQVMGPGL